MKPSNDLHETLKSMQKPKVQRTLHDSDAKKRAAKLLGSAGGQRGGPARARSLTKERRSEIASLGGKAARKAKGK